MNIRPHRPEPPRIDLTSLIDVVFLMLIFFMVSTTFDKETQLKVDLPEASTQPSEPQEVEKIEVVVDASGQFYVNEKELVRHDAETLKRALQSVLDGRADLPVSLFGDQKAPYAAIMTVMDVAGELGLSKLSFVARQEVPGSKP